MKKLLVWLVMLAMLIPGAVSANGEILDLSGSMDLEITKPAPGATLFGSVGQAVDVSVYFKNAVEGDVTYVIREAETGKEIGSMVNPRFQGAPGEFTGNFQVPVSEEFVSGGEYEIVVSEGEATTYTRVTMMNEESFEEKETPVFYVKLGYAGNDGEAPIEDFLQGDKYVIPLHDSAYFYYNMTGGTGLYHLTLTGQTPEGELLQGFDNWHESEYASSLWIGDASACGAFVLEVSSGSWKKEYAVEFTAENVEETGYYGKMQDWPSCFVEADFDPFHIRVPRAGAVLAACSGEEFDIDININHAMIGSSPIKVEVIHSSSGKVIHKETRENPDQYYSMGGGRIEVENNTASGTYKVRATQGNYTDEVEFTLLNVSQADKIALGMKEAFIWKGRVIPESVSGLALNEQPSALLQGRNVCICTDPQVLARISEVYGQLSAAAAGEEFSLGVYRSGAGNAEGPIGTCAVYLPAVQEQYVETAISRIDETAVATAAAQYQFQNSYFFRETGAAPIDPEGIGEWSNLTVCGFAEAGMTDGEGVSYSLLPVYVADGEGNPAGDQMYLFVYAVASEPDVDYLKRYDIEFENTDGLYRTESVFIADQQTVSAILDLVLTDESIFIPAEVEYEPLAKGSKGDAVKKLQQKLIAMGYLTGSADGIYGNMSKEAVAAYQTDMGLEPTGEADSETQKMLFAQASAQELLKDWMDRH